jgi:drug/metabolite transporter (DMT)-like permease
LAAGSCWASVRPGVSSARWRWRSAGETILPQSLQGWLAVIALGLVSHALGQGLITLSLGSYGASAASLVMVWPALVSVLAAWALFAEQPSPAQAFGGVAILAAVLLVRKG